MANQNPRVSQEEMRAKRLAQEQQGQVSIDPQTEMATTPLVVTKQEMPEADFKALVPDKPAVPNLDELLASMDAAQLAKIRSMAAAKGLSVPNAGDGTKGADGSLTITIHLDPQVTEQLEIWAEADGLTLVQEAQKRITEALENYLYGDWNPVPEPAPVAAPVAAATGAK